MTKKILILYYTGTNNTLYIVNSLKKKLEKNYIVSSNNILGLKEINNEYDLLILCYPIYAFNSPKIFEKSIMNLNITNKDYLIIKNSGEGLKFNNASSYYIHKKLEHNNCNFINEYHLLMPYNILFKHKDNMVKQMLIYNDKYLDYIVSNIYNTKKYKTNILNRFTCFLGKLQRVGALINGPLVHSNKNCIKCNKCIINCPVNSLHIKNNKIIGSTKCIMCMRCTINCNNNAINFGLLDKIKVNKKYDFNKINNNKDLDGDYLKESSKIFYKNYHKYYEDLNNLLK